MLRFTRLMVAAALITAALPCPYVFAQEKPLRVFAAASLKNAIADIDVAFTEATGVELVARYNASSELAKMIAEGATADVFISADLRSMDYVAERKLNKPDTRVNLLGNRLVLVAATGSKLDKVEIAKGLDIAKLAGDGRIAVADVKAVPAGIYAKAALEMLGAWAATEPKLIEHVNVRTTLLAVVRGESAIGIVYETDAKSEPKVKVIGVFPEGSHPPIIYPVAATVVSRDPVVARYLDFLRGSAAKAIFENHGFRYLFNATS